jgi:hypothetical protein
MHDGIGCFNGFGSSVASKEKKPAPVVVRKIRSARRPPAKFPRVAAANVLNIVRI